ncbi:MAG: tetratricopeptide repeat protein [Vicinamibacteria bacterium]
MRAFRAGIAAFALVLAVAAPLRAASDPCTDPGNAAKANDALAKVRAKQFAAGDAAANGVLAACPTHAVATQAMGQSLVAQKRYDDAIARLTTAITAKPDLAYAYLWRGYAHYYKKQPDKLIGDFQTFLRLQPTAPEASTVKQLLASLNR